MASPFQRFTFAEIGAITDNYALSAEPCMEEHNTEERRAPAFRGRSASTVVPRPRRTLRDPRAKHSRRATPRQCSADLVDDAAACVRHGGTAKYDAFYRKINGFMLHESVAKMAKLHVGLRCCRKKHSAPTAILYAVDIPCMCCLLPALESVRRRTQKRASHAVERSL
jgi:hypothetical protein